MSQLNRSRFRPSIEPLEARRLLAATVTEFPIPSGTVGVTAGSDGAIWFPLDGHELGRMTTSGSLSRIDVGAALTGGIAKGPDGTIWFTASMSRIGRRTMAGDVSFFDVPSGQGDRDPRIVADGDGNIWFTEQTANKIGRLTAAGDITEFTLPTAQANPVAICAGPDGNIWFTEFNVRAVGRISPTGHIDEFAAPARPPDFQSGKSYFSGIAAGPDGNLWFTEQEGVIGRITTEGQITEFNLPQPAGGSPYGICAGPDGNLWFTDLSSGAIGRITPNGQVRKLAIPADKNLSFGIAAGADGNIWFGDSYNRELDRVNLAYTDLAVSVTTAPSPAQAGKPLTYTVTVTNHAPTAATNVVLTDRVPSVNSLLVSYVASQGTAQQSSRLEGTQFNVDVIAQFGTLAPGASATLTIVIQPTKSGTFSNQAVVQADESDLKASDDTAKIVTTVAASSTTDPPPGGTTTPPAPAYRGAQKLYIGKGAKRKLVGFRLKWSGALDLVSARTRSHYQLTQPGRTKRSAMKVISVKSLGVSTDGLLVTLGPGKYDTRKPLKLMIAGLSGAGGQAVATVAIKL